MLGEAFRGDAPPDLAKMLAEVKRLVRKVGQLRAESFAEQQKLESLDSRGRDGRQRFGFAVDALGVDASKARDEARQAHAQVAPLTCKVAASKLELMEAHKEILMWEGRSAFQEPYEGLRDAYANAAKAVGAWLGARRAERLEAAKADDADRLVADLEFQIQELRAALAKLEQDVEAEQTNIQNRISELDKQTEALQVELLALATRFCAPLRRRSELGPLFRELEADAAAA
jgi:serine/threonine-protein kinase